MNGFVEEIDYSRKRCANIYHIIGHEKKGNLSLIKAAVIINC